MLKRKEQQKIRTWFHSLECEKVAVSWSIISQEKLGNEVIT